MPTQYQEFNFKQFVATNVKALELVTAVDQTNSADAADLVDDDRGKFEAAITSFLEPTTVKPDHLKELNSALQESGLDEHRAAYLSLSIEGLRQASGRTAVQPLLDRRAPSDPALGKWWNDIQQELGNSPVTTQLVFGAQSQGLDFA